MLTRSSFLGSSRTFALLVALCFCLGGLHAQTEELVNISYDLKRDSVFFTEMRTRMADIRRREGRPTVGLVLAGGGAKGAAHIGVLKYIEELGIPIDFVAGTSMGALIGGMYALGYSATEIDSIVRSIDWNMMMSDDIPMEFYSYYRTAYQSTYFLDIPFDGMHFLRSLPSGILYGLNVYNMLSTLSVGYQHEMDFLSLPTPFCCVATEVVSQKEKHWSSGSIIDALRSTMSIPGYFQPVRVDSMILCDGGTKNNFPVDLAKAAGADIIIGVEMTLPRDYGKVNNIADILMQTAQYSGGLEAHNENVSKTTVYITPDITGFGMLSFGSNEINTLINNGYTAAIEHARELDSIVRITGNAGRKIQQPKATNTSQTKVKVTSVDYEGISEKEMKFISSKVRIPLNEYLGQKDFEIAQSIIYGTMAFSQVTYRLIPDSTDGYRLLFKCEKRPPNAIGVGLRIDSEQWFAALLDFGFGRNTIYGNVFEVKARLSMSPYLHLGWTHTPVKGMQVGASLQINYQTLFGINNFFEKPDVYVQQSLRDELRVFLSSTHWSQVNLHAGFRVEHMPYFRSIAAGDYRYLSDWKHFYPYIFLRFAYDSEDDHYFPDRGLKVTVSYDYDFRRAHYAGAGLKGTIPVCNFFAIRAGLRGRYIFGEQKEYSVMNNYVGGSMDGRYYEHQIPFVGVNGEILCHELLTVVDLDLRFRVTKKSYVSALVSAMHDGSLLDGKLSMNKHAALGVGLQYAFRSKFGPMLANVQWNTITKKASVYFSVGYDF